MSDKRKDKGAKMGKGKDKSLRQRAVEAYRQKNQCNIDELTKQFQKTFAVEPDRVSALVREDILIEANGLLIRSWLTADNKPWYALVSQCIECKNIFDCSSGIGRAFFGNLVELGKALEELGENYKAEIVCNDCIGAYHE